MPRVFLNGCFDLLHFGHVNALRQAKQYKFGPGDNTDDRKVPTVVAGIHSNAEIRRVKGGAFINSEEEKERLLLACRWVDEVSHDVPYGVIRAEDFGCDFVVHGDDEVFLKSENCDMYGDAKAKGNFRYIRRTEGISTTLMIERFFAMGETEQEKTLPTDEDEGGNGAASVEYLNASAQRIALFCHERLLDQGGVGNSPASVLSRPRTRTVFIQGYWDLLHCGYLDILQEIRRRESENLDRGGTLCLICGVLRERVAASPGGQFGEQLANGNINQNENQHSVEEYARKNQSTTGVSTTAHHTTNAGTASSPATTIFQSVHERGLMLLSLRTVDDVIFDVQKGFSQKFRKALGIDVTYAVSSHFDFDARDCGQADVVLDGCGIDSTRTILERFVCHREEFVERRKVKVEPEMAVKGEKTLSAA